MKEGEEEKEEKNGGKIRIRGRREDGRSGEGAVYVWHTDWMYMVCNYIRIRMERFSNDD